MRAALEKKIVLQRSTQTADPIWVRVEWEPENASLSLLDPKNLGCAAQLFRRERKTEERRALVRVAASAHPRHRVWLPEQPSRPSAGAVLARPCVGVRCPKLCAGPDDRESFTGGDICSESFAGGEICTELPKYGFTDLVCQSTDLESRRYGFTELVCQSTDLVC